MKNLKMSFPRKRESRHLDSPVKPGNDRVMQRAQASIEATLSLICLALLLMGGLRIYLWSAKHAVARQQGYEEDRVKAASGGDAKIILPKESNLPKLAIFNESGIKTDDTRD